MKWVLEDHVCRHCGGRVLQCVSGQGPTGGGNPVFKCADCGRGSAAMGPEVICWCGYSHRGQHATAYRCLPFSILKEKPQLLSAFRSCGCEPGRTEVGVMLKEDFLSGMRSD